MVSVAFSLAVIVCQLFYLIHTMERIASALEKADEEVEYSMAEDKDDEYEND